MHKHFKENPDALLLIFRGLSKKMFVFEQLVVTGQDLVGAFFSETLFVNLMNNQLASQHAFVCFY